MSHSFYISPAGSPRPERGSLSGLIKTTHRALLGSGSLLASVGLGRCLDFPPRVPPRTNPSSLGDRTPSEPEISPPKPLISDPPVVDDLVTFSTSEQLPRPLLDLALQYQELKPLPLTPPPPNPRERSGHRTPQMPQSPQSPRTPRTPLPHSRASPGEWTPCSHSTNGELGCETLEHRADRRRRSSQGLHTSQLGQSDFTNFTSQSRLTSHWENLHIIYRKPVLLTEGCLVLPDISKRFYQAALWEV